MGYKTEDSIRAVMEYGIDPTPDAGGVCNGCGNGCRNSMVWSVKRKPLRLCWHCNNTVLNRIRYAGGYFPATFELPAE